jgi:2-aminoadipate transaminase
LDRSARTIYLSTFSKTLAPGLRIAWIAGPEPVISQCVTAKQAMDLCSPSFTQAIAAELLRRGHLKRRLAGTVALYRGKCQAMIDALTREMPDGVTWTKPEGGLFLWVRLPEGMDAGAMLKTAVTEEAVMYVPGGAFHADGSGRNTMRLNFSYPSEDEIRNGIARLAALVRRNQPSPVHTIHRRGTNVSN